MGGTTKNVTYKYTPHKYQLIEIDKSERFNVRVCHRRFGKTVLEIAGRLIPSAIKAKTGNARYIYMAPFLSQGKSVAWDYLKDYGGCIPGTKFNESELRCDFLNGSRIQIVGGDNPDSIRGRALDGVVLDETGQIKPEIWDSIIRPALADRKGWADFIGTPSGINMFYNLYNLAHTEPGWRASMYRVTDTDILDSEEVEVMRKTMSPSMFAQELMCDFNASSDDVFIQLELVLSSVGKGYHISVYHKSPKVMGIDVGRDADATVIQKRQGLVMYNPIELRIPDNMQVASRIAREIDDFKPDAVHIDAGMGSGVIDRLRQLGYKVIGVPFGSAADRPDQYGNKRAEMYGELKDWLKMGGSLPQDQELITDITSPLLQSDRLGRIILEDKKKIRQRLGRSPDKGDAAALTFAYTVRSKADRQRKRLRKPRKHNVFGRFKERSV